MLCPKCNYEGPGVLHGGVQHCPWCYVSPPLFDKANDQSVSERARRVSDSRGEALAATWEQSRVSDPCQSVAEQRWRVGDRVSRPVFIDDGTWLREGDKCLPRSPLKYGVVERIHLEERKSWWNPGVKRLWLYEVLFDDGSRGDYFWHGLHAA